MKRLNLHDVFFGHRGIQKLLNSGIVTVRNVDNVFDNNVDYLISSKSDSDVKLFLSFSTQDVSEALVNNRTLQMDFITLSQYVVILLDKIFREEAGEVVKLIKKLRKYKGYLRIVIGYIDDGREMATYELRFQVVFVPDVRRVSKSIKFGNKTVKIAELGKSVLFSHQFKSYVDYSKEVPVVKSDFIYTVYNRRVLENSVPVEVFLKLYMYGVSVFRELYKLSPFSIILFGVSTKLALLFASVESSKMTAIFSGLAGDENKFNSFLMRFHAVRVIIKNSGNNFVFILREFSNDYASFGRDVVYHELSLPRGGDVLSVLADEYSRLLDNILHALQGGSSRKRV